jgi:hypothetical protein
MYVGVLRNTSSCLKHLGKDFAEKTSPNASRIVASMAIAAIM